MHSKFTGDKPSVPTIDVTGIKLDIINAAHAYASSQFDLGANGNLRVGDPEYQALVAESIQAWTTLYKAISVIDSL